MTAAVEQIMEVLPAWGACRLISPLKGGHRNVALLIELNGAQAVAKSSRRSEEAILWLDVVLDRAERSGFRVPRYLDSRNGRRVVGGVTVETWLGGSPMPASEFGQVHSLIRRFHDLTRNHPQRPGFSSSLELLHLDGGGDVDLSSMPRSIVDACRTAWRALDGLTQSVVHGDLGSGNLIRAEDGRPGLVDWDEARVDVSLLDEIALESVENLVVMVRSSPTARALLAWEVAASWHIEPEHARRLSVELLIAIGASG